MKFKIGDKVRVRKDLKVDEEYGNDTFVPEMRPWLGKMVVIKYICPDGEYKIINCPWSWTDEMFESDEEITITRHGNNVVAKCGKKVGVAKCSPKDEFDFAIGAKLAFARLMGMAIAGLNDNFDWDKFKAGKFFVKCTKDNFKSFVAEAKKNGCTFKPNENYDPFEDYRLNAIARKFARRLGYDYVDENEITFIFKEGRIKCNVAILPDMEIVTW